MTSSLLSFVITIVLVALGAAASGKGKMKKTRKFIPPNPAWRNGQPGQTAPMQQAWVNRQQQRPNSSVQQAWANRQQIPQGQQRGNQQPSQGQMRAYQKQMAMGYGQRPVQTAQGSSVPKNVQVAKKSSGSAILDRVLRENQDTDTREYNEEETVILDPMGLSMPKIEQSPYMEEVYQMMVTGYEVKMPEQRDFVMEGLALLDQHVG